MPPKSKPADSEHLSEERIRERAYLLWEADGRPEGRGEHYWYLAHEEARRFVVERTADAVARVTKGRHPNAAPTTVKPAKIATARPTKVTTTKPAAAKAKTKPVEAKPVRKAAPKPRAAEQKAI